MDIEKIVSLCKRRGFVFQSSEEYGGATASYDYGHLGMLFKNNIKEEWWKEMIRGDDNIVGLDSAILMHPRVWEASGHVENFTDPLVECKVCHKRFRADHLLEKEVEEEHGLFSDKDLSLMARLIEKIKCPECKGQLTSPRQFNLMFKTFIGPVEETARQIYLRPETAQGIYIDYKRICQSMRLKIPFGIAQIGKAFRNEITPSEFIYRTIEFEQMEMQWFCRPREVVRWFEYWKDKRMKWYLNLGIKKENLKFREHERNELAHYAKKAVDIEYKFPFGWKEIEGIHNRGDWDLSRHSQFSGKDLSYFDSEKKEKFIPYIVETSAGVDRSFFAFLCEAYKEIEGGRTTTTESTKEREIVLQLDKRLAPIKIAVLPLVKKEKLQKLALDIYHRLQKQWMVQYDEVGSIGRRYRRQDEIGTPYCLTVDFETLEDKSVTIRDRDTMKQERIRIEALIDWFKEYF